VRLGNNITFVIFAVFNVCNKGGSPLTMCYTAIYSVIQSKGACIHSVMVRAWDSQSCSADSTFGHFTVTYSNRSVGSWSHPHNGPLLPSSVIRYRLKAVITIIAIRLRYDYDPTTTYRARLLPI